MFFDDYNAGVISDKNCLAIPINEVDSVFLVGVLLREDYQLIGSSI